MSASTGPSFDSEKFLSDLNRNWGDNKVCPICGKRNWSVSPDVHQLLKFSGGTLVIGGSVIPIVSVTCTNCGYTLMFNPLISGALKSQED